MPIVAVLRARRGSGDEVVAKRATVGAERRLRRRRRRRRRPRGHVFLDGGLPSSG